VTKPVEGQRTGQESAMTHGGLQVPVWAVCVQGLPPYFDSANPKRPHQHLDDYMLAEERFVL